MDVALTAGDLARMIRRRVPTLPNSLVYAIQAGEHGPVKIGRTDNPAQRLKTLQTGNHEQLRGLAAWPEWLGAEGDLHREFADAHIRGEWFRPDPGLLEAVELLGGYFCDWETT